MAQCKLSPQEFIRHAFTPQIAVLPSSSVDDLCRKNNLTFLELLQPFSNLNSDVNLQDGVGGIISIHNLKITLVDVNFRPPQTVLARKFLNASVSQSAETRMQTIQVGEYTLNTPTTTPWFEAWRDIFLQVQYPSDHEFTKHYLACMLVISSVENNPVEAMHVLNQTLNQLQNVASNKMPRWFSSNILRYYVLVHDNVESDLSKTMQSLETLNLSYGISNVFLLKMNSRPPGQIEEQLPDPWSQYISNTFETIGGAWPSPDNSPSTSVIVTGAVEVEQERIGSDNMLPYHPLSPDLEADKLNEALEKEKQKLDNPVSVKLHGMCLTTEDVEQIKLLIYEFCTRALLPYVERQILNITEVVSNKKGVSKSLFSATKRWFTPNKAGANNNTTNMPIYASDAPELQMRKLADLYFMFCHYTMAFQAYHAAKRDFNLDQAWFYYAGALEMAALSAFMANECSRKTCDYFEEGIATYISVCKMAQFATRATLLSTECLKSRNLHGEAAHQLIRMTSEESDLRSALLLEQAAYCFLNGNRSQMVRKYAFHMVLAGHRFTKAAQRKHALRCYRQALEVYQNKGWTFAEDHVHYTIGKLATALGSLEAAACSFSKLLTIQTKQTAEQQTMFLKEYLLIHQMLHENDGNQERPILLLPVIKLKATKILVGPTPPLSVPGKVRALGITFSTDDDIDMHLKWLKLEEMVVQEAQGSLPFIFKPVVTLYTKDNFNNANIIAVIKEPIQVSLMLCNPLAVPLNLKDLYLLWSFKDASNTIITNEGPVSEADTYLKMNVIKTLVIEKYSSQEVILFLTPLMVGKLTIDGIFYKITNSDDADGEDATVVDGKQLFELNQFWYTQKKETQNIQQTFHLSIVPPAPCLQINFEDVCTDLLCNEIKPIAVEMRNVGSVPLHKVYLATSTPHLLSSCELENKPHTTTEIVDLNIPAVKERIARKNHVSRITLPNGCLEPSQNYSFNIWVKAPSTKGNITADLLIYYENNNATNVPSHSLTATVLLLGLYNSILKHPSTLLLPIYYSFRRYRLIRHVWLLKVHESLAITLAVTESCKSDKVKELLFGIKAINLNKNYLTASSEITLLKAGLLSSCWKLKALETVTPNPLVIHSEQSAYMVLRSSRRISKSNKYYEINLTDENVNNDIAFVDFAKGMEQSKINFFENTPPTIQSKAANEGTLFYQWRARNVDNFKNEKTASGQTFLTIDKYMENEESKFNQEDIGQLMGLGDSNQQLSNENENQLAEELHTQITVAILHGSDIYHDFNRNKVCIIPVKIAIHNDSRTTCVITLNTVGTSASSSQSSRRNEFYQQPSKDYQWVGFNGTTKTLAALTSDMILLYVAVSSPGIYDLGGRLEIFCQNELYDKPILQDSQALGYLIVKSN